MMDTWEHEIMQSAYGEHCAICGDPANHKVGEETEKPIMRHNWTAYLCCDHFSQLMGPIPTKSCLTFKGRKIKYWKHIDTLNAVMSEVAPEGTGWLEIDREDYDTAQERQRKIEDYETRYAARLVERHGYTPEEAKESAEAADIDIDDLDPVSHADDEASYQD
jgi:hypothetical protein